MEETNGANSPSRMDRVERIIEVLANTQIDMQQDVKILLRGQIALGDSLEKLVEAQRHTDGRLNALIAVVDDLVRRDPRHPQN